MGSVVHCKEISQRDHTEEVSSRKRYTRTFQLLTDDPKVGAKAIREHNELPEYGDPWEQLDENNVVVAEDASAVLVQKRVSQSDEGNFQNWMCWCEYAGINDPTREPPRVQWGGSRQQEATWHDLIGQRYANSAGDMFLNGFIRDRTRLEIVIERNVLFWDPTIADDYIDTLNLNPYLATRYPPGIDAETAKIYTLNAEVVWWESYPENAEIHYYRVRAIVEIDRRGWTEIPLDYGYRQKIGLDTVRVPDVGGSHSGPILLDGTGLKLGGGAPPVFLDGVAGRPGPFIKYNAVDWGPIDFILEW